MSDFCRRVVACALCSVTIVLSGCKSTGNPGPIYKLQGLQESGSSAAIAVSVTDARPPEEKKYRKGAMQPCDYRNGIETLILENFEPLVTDLLKQSLTQRLATLSKPPVWADVEVTRFRVIVDRREILAAAYEEQLMADRVDSAVDIGVGLGTGGAGGVAGGLMAAAATENSLRRLDADRTSWDHAMSGVTCEIELRVQLHWEGGHRDKFILSTKSHSLPPDDCPIVDLGDGMKWSIAPTVEKAIDQIGIDLQLKAPASLAHALESETEELPPSRP